MEVVRALHPEIARMQMRAAFLLSMSQRGFRDGQDGTQLCAEADALQSAVEAHSEQLHQHMAALPPEVRNHGRIVDTVRALQSVHTILGEARRGLAFVAIRGKAPAPMSPPRQLLPGGPASGVSVAN
ncbi:MAG TPA: hypothetical protein VFE52_10195 [Devosia sp.]|nr:hypothetical protein [Devosia sp.]